MVNEVQKKKAPEQENKRIVVGMTGRMDSVVVAYLLKKQGLSPIAVAVINFEKMMGKKTVKVDGFDKYIDADISLYGACHIDNLNNTKKICEQLGIPFYATSTKDIFREDVLGKLVTSRLSGEKFSPCIGCHTLIIKTLIEKAKELDANKVATGHYAKVLSAQHGEQLIIGRSNDLVNDQSYLLAGLTFDEMKKLLLPLSDMRKKDAEKICQSLGITFQTNATKSGDCLSNDPKLNDFLTYMSSPNLRKKGSILEYKNDVFVTDHSGFHIYTNGQKNLPTIDGNTIDREATVVDIDPVTGHVYIGDWNAISYRLTVLINFVSDKFLDLSRPCEVFIKFEINGESLPCIIFYRTLSSCVILLKTEQKGRAPAGRTAVLYNRAGVGAKLIGHGEVMSYAPFENLEKLYETSDMSDPVEKMRNLKAKEDNQKLGF